MIRPAIAALAATLALYACGSPAVPPAQNYGTLRGRVLDAATNSPIPGALVTVNVVLSGTAGADGTYVVKNLPVGQDSVQVTAPGYAAKSDFINVQPGQTISVDYSLTK